MDPPLGVPGVSKDVPGSTKHANWGLVCYKIAPKLKKKCQKNPVFLDIFEDSSNWGES